MANLTEWPYSYEPDSDTTPPSPTSGTASPRTDLLSPAENYSPNQFSTAIQQRQRRPSTQTGSSRRGPSERFMRDRERIHSGVSKRDLVKALINEEYETKQTRRVLYKAYDKYQHENGRATEAEGRALEAAQRYRVLNDAKVRAEAESGRLREELRMYKLQLENAQSEIHKAQTVLEEVERQRDDAEASAARARDTARKLNEARLVEQAMEEGRRLGFEEGIRMGKELGFEEGRNLAYDEREQPVGQDEEQELTPPGTPPPPILPLRDPAPRVRSRKSSVASTRAKTTNVADPIVSPMPMTPPSNSLRQPDVQIPPVNWIPSAVGPSRLNNMPPLQELVRTPPPASDTASFRSKQQASPSVRARDFAFETPPSHVPPRPNSLDSQGSTHYSKASVASTTLSNMDLVSPPQTSRHQGKRNLSVIPEDTSSVRTSPNTSIRGSVAFPPLPQPPVTPTTPTGVSFIPPPPLGFSTDSPTQLAEARARDRKLSEKSRQRKQEQRYSDPKAVDEWMRNGSASSSRRPGQVSVPSPLSSQSRRNEGEFDSPGHQRTRSMASTSNQSLNIPGQGPRLHRRSMSSSSTVPEIIIEPPSRPSSDHLEVPSTIRGSNQLLSPDHATHPLPPVDQSAHRRYDPPPAPALSSQTGWGESIHQVLSTNLLPPGFAPQGPPVGTLPRIDTPESIPIPIPPPRPGIVFSSAYAPSPTSGQAVLPDMGLGRPGMSKPTTTLDSTRSKTPTTHYSNIYGPPVVPAGNSSGSIYPYPGASPGSSNAQLPGVGQSGSYAYSPGHRRSVSLNAGFTPHGRPHNLSQ